MNRFACLWPLFALGCYERLEFGVPNAAGGTGSNAGTGGSAGQAGAATSAAASGAAGAGGVHLCAQDIDCALASLRCEVQSGVCFECVADDDCRARGLVRCDGELHRCVQCGADQDCSSGYACDLTTRACVQRCAQDVPCPATAHNCDDTRLVCVECEAEDDDDGCALYPDRPHCLIPGNRCAQCRTDADCSVGLRCDAVTGTCVGCRDSRDCPGNEACDPTSHACVPG